MKHPAAKCVFAFPELEGLKSAGLTTSIQYNESEDEAEPIKAVDKPNQTLGSSALSKKSDLPPILFKPNTLWDVCYI